MWAGQLTHDYSFGIYFNRIAAAHSPLEAGNRPNPKHTTSFQVILTAEGAIKMCVRSSHSPTRDTDLSALRMSQISYALRVGTITKPTLARTVVPKSRVVGFSLGGVLR